jgi:hypothetical protein
LRRQLGMSWLELAVVSVVLSLVAVLFAQRLSDYQELAERAGMEYGITMFKSALRIRLSVLLMEGRLQDVGHLRCDNPVHWLEQPPAHYVGEVSGEAVRHIPPGNWYFDPSECSMGYMVKYDKHLTFDSVGLKRVRYHVSVEGKGSRGLALGLAFDPVEPYRWQIQ